MPKAHSKRYTSALKVADLTKDYPLAEAVEVLTKFPKAKFDESVDLAVKLGVDVAKNPSVRGTVALPAGSGRSKKVAVTVQDPHPDRINRDEPEVRKKDPGKIEGQHHGRGMKTDPEK